LVVQVAGVASLVVELGRRAGRYCAEGPLVDGGVEARVADVAGEYGAFLAGGNR
jgi:hypothetical protein